MKVDDKTIEELEFKSILRILKSKAFSNYGKAYFDTLRFPEDLEKTFKQVNEATLKMEEISKVIYHVEDVSEALNLAAEGHLLESKQIMNFAELFKISGKLSELLRESKEMKDFSEDMIPPPNFISKCEHTFNPDGSVKDNATPELLRVRKELRTVGRSVTERVKQLLANGVSNGYISDPLVLQRHERYVLPVSSQKRSMVRGIVHGQSSSAATCYIEPEELIEFNDTLAILRSKESAEISLILSAMTKFIYDNSHQIHRLVRAWEKFDAVCARAKYSIQNECEIPMLKSDGSVRIISGRNPLIPSKKVIPIDFELCPQNKVVILSGPNTGGKTATLKTIGLFVLMTAMGVPIPTGKGTEISLFNSLFSDIGDHQSVKDELSTFSAKVRREDKICAVSDEKTLVLIDEMGDGTEPMEGIAFTKAVVKMILKRDIKAIITTHLPELKTMAFDDPRIRNASVGFDVEHMVPTYRIHMDMPGRSHAFEIVEKLGVSNELIENFKNGRTTSFSQTDVLVERLQTVIFDYEERLKKLEIKEKEVLERKMKVDDEFKKLRENRLEELSEEVKEFSNNLSQAKKEFESAIHTLKNSKDINELKTQDKKMAKLREKIKELEKFKNSKAQKIKVGDRVEVVGTNTQGNVVREEKGDVIVEIGNVQVKLGSDKVKIVDGNSKSKKAQSDYDYEMAERSPTEVDVRGMIVEDAIPVVEEFANRVLKSKSIGYVIHGKGTGRLANGLWTFLRSRRIPFRIGKNGEGGTGVTVIGGEKK